MATPAFDNGQILFVGDFVNPVQPLWVTYTSTNLTGPDLAVSTLTVNPYPAGNILLQATTEASTQYRAPLIFQRPTGDINAPSESLVMNLSHIVPGYPIDGEFITATKNSGTAYDDIAVKGLQIFGDQTTSGNAGACGYITCGPFPNTLGLDTGAVYMSSLYVSSLSVVSVVSSSTNAASNYTASQWMSTPQLYSGYIDNKFSITSADGYFSSIHVGHAFISTALISTANISTANVSTLNAQTVNSEIANFSSVFISSVDTLTIDTIRISSIIGDISLTLVSTLSLFGNPNINPNINLGLGNVIQGLIGGAASQGLGVVLGAAALVTGATAMVTGRTSGGVNSNIFQTVNGSTQLQFSTLGESVSSIFLTTNSLSPLTTPGQEIRQEIQVPAGTYCLRSVSDPLNITNNISAIQMFGQWVPVIQESAVIPNLTVSTLTVSTAKIYNDNVSTLTVSTINGQPYVPGGVPQIPSTLLASTILINGNLTQSGTGQFNWGGNTMTNTQTNFNTPVAANNTLGVFGLTIAHAGLIANGPSAEFGFGTPVIIRNNLSVSGHSGAATMSTNSMRVFGNLLAASIDATTSVTANNMQTTNINTTTINNQAYPPPSGLALIPSTLFASTVSVNGGLTNIGVAAITSGQINANNINTSNTLTAVNADITNLAINNLNLSNAGGTISAGGQMKFRLANGSAHYRFSDSTGTNTGFIADFYADHTTRLYSSLTVRDLTYPIVGPSAARIQTYDPSYDAQPWGSILTANISTTNINTITINNAAYPPAVLPAVFPSTSFLSTVNVNGGLNVTNGNLNVTTINNNPYPFVPSTLNASSITVNGTLIQSGTGQFNWGNNTITNTQTNFNVPVFTLNTLTASGATFLNGGTIMNNGLQVASGNLTITNGSITVGGTNTIQASAIDIGANGFIANLSSFNISTTNLNVSTINNRPYPFVPSTLNASTINVKGGLNVTGGNIVFNNPGGFGNLTGTGEISLQAYNGPGNPTYFEVGWDGANSQVLALGNGLQTSASLASGNIYSGEIGTYYPQENVPPLGTMFTNLVSTTSLQASNAVTRGFTASNAVISSINGFQYPVPNSFTPVGAIMIWSGGEPINQWAIPAGWLRCDGTEVSKITYAALFAIIGNNYQYDKSPSTLDYFFLPDLTFAVPMGAPYANTNGTVNGTVNQVPYLKVYFVPWQTDYVIVANEPFRQCWKIGSVEGQSTAININTLFPSDGFGAGASGYPSVYVDTILEFDGYVGYIIVRSIDGSTIPTTNPGVGLEFTARGAGVRADGNYPLQGFNYEGRARTTRTQQMDEIAPHNHHYFAAVENQPPYTAIMYNIGQPNPELPNVDYIVRPPTSVDPVYNRTSFNATNILSTISTVSLPLKVQNIATGTAPNFVNMSYIIKY